MKLAEIRKEAKARGVDPGKMDRTALVRAIQSAEGNPQCFDTRRTECPETACLWRVDCLPDGRKT